MIFTKVRLRPFAGVADLTLEFGPGLNTVVGENEAGKSTVYRALENGLLERTNLTPARLTKFLDPLLPVGGGDTIAVELHLEHDAGQYLLRRQWGATRGSQLTLPDGGLVTADDEIAERVSDMLGVSHGTCRSILFTRQTALPNTLVSLEDQDNEVVRDLSDLLSATVQETDGVSVDALKARLEDEYDRFYSRWDSDKDRPEGNRGISKPWKKEVGRILEAYYTVAEIRQALNEAQAKEQQVDDLNAELAELTGRSAELSAYVDTNRAVANDAGKRRVLEAERQSLEERLKRFKKDNEDWPLAKKAVEDAEKNSSELMSRITELMNEEADVKRHAEGQALRDLAKRVKGRHEELVQAREKLAGTPQVSREKLEVIDAAASRCREFEVKLEAVKLRAKLTAKKELRVRVKTGLEKPRESELKANSAETIEADGSLTIEHDEWALEVEASELDIAAIAEGAKEARSALEKALAETGAASREEAARLNEVYEEAKAALANAESNLAAELGDKTVEELEEQLPDGEADESGIRSLEVVVREQTDAEHALSDHDEAIRKNRNRLTELEEEYGDSDGLLMTMATAVGEKTKLEEELAKLAPLPDGVDDVDTFLEEFAEKEDELKECDSDINEKRIKLAEVRLPEESTEELEARLTLAEEAFERTKRQGSVIERIIEAVEEVEADAESGDRYASFRAEVERYVSHMTSERYQSIRIDEGLPSGFVRGDGQVLGAHLLSTGTNDVLGLAIRLAMAGFFLDGKQGFLVMDDPLVDMDPCRQQQAASLLRGYAEENGRQVIVFTCFPGHAEMLEGRRVGLG